MVHRIGGPDATVEARHEITADARPNEGQHGSMETADGHCQANQTRTSAATVTGASLSESTPVMGSSEAVVQATKKMLRMLNKNTRCPQEGDPP